MSITTSSKLRKELLMKKLILLHLLAFVVILSSCGSPDIEDSDVDAGADADAARDNLTEEQEFFLEDLDYMLYVLETNFALFDVAHWARGVDISAIFENMSEVVLNNSDIDVDEFYINLIKSFDPLEPIGHFLIIPPMVHQRIVLPPRTWENTFFSRRALERLELDHVMYFYEPRHIDESMQDVLNELEARELINSNVRLERILNRLSLFKMQELAESARLAVAEERHEEAIQLIINMMDISNDIPNVTTSVIQEGRIAYLAVNSFWAARGQRAWYRERDQIIEFLRDIYDFEHLIIDLRANSGGTHWHFFDSVVSPLISDTLQVNGHVFFNYDGKYTREYVNSRQWEDLGMAPDFDSVRPVDEILAETDLPNFNYDDADRLSHGFPISVRIRPQQVHAHGATPIFDGKIWLLTGPYMGSGAQIVPWVVKEIGFATLVGGVTRGVYGGLRTFIALPNSGIVFRMDLFYVTDQYGFPLEAGTTPHHFNREGMDALETALALIEEGVYR
jgi:hypothetical protein